MNILIQWFYSIVDTIGTQLAVLPSQRGVPNSGVDLCTALSGLDSRSVTFIERMQCIRHMYVCNIVPHIRA